MVSRIYAVEAWRQDGKTHLLRAGLTLEEAKALIDQESQEEERVQDFQNKILGFILAHGYRECAAYYLDQIHAFIVQQPDYPRDAPYWSRARYHYSPKPVVMFYYCQRMYLG